MKKLVACVGVLAVASAAFAGTKFITSYRAPGVPPTTFAGQKVAAVFFTEDNGFRVSIEEILARQLTARGVTGVAAYRLLPKELTKNKEAARDFFKRAGIKGVVALRILSVEERQRWEPSVWVGSYYSTWSDYYGYAWGPGMAYGSTTVLSGSLKKDTTLSIEALVFRVEDGLLAWAGMSETTNPERAEPVVKDLVTGIIKAMQARGLITK
jgi:hypothetical protein